MGKLEDIRDHRDRNGEDFRRRRKYAVPPEQWAKLEQIAKFHHVRIDNLIEALIGVGINALTYQDQGREFFITAPPPHSDEILRIEPWYPIRIEE